MTVWDFFAIWTGLRTSELIALKWTDLDEKIKNIYICRAKVLGQEKMPKTKKGEETFPYSQELCDHYKAKKATLLK